MVYIIIKNSNILTTCETLDSVYHNILTYCRIILYCDKNKITYFDDLKIIKYENGIPIISYYINTNTLDLYDEHKNKITIKNNTIQRNKVELEVLLKKDAESDINFVIPFDLNDNESESDCNNKDDDDDDYDNNLNNNIYIKSNQQQPNQSQPNQSQPNQSQQNQSNQYNHNQINHNQINHNQTNQQHIQAKQHIQLLQKQQSQQQKQQSQQQKQQSQQQNKDSVVISTLEENNKIKILQAKIELEKIKLEKNNTIYDQKMDKYLETKHQAGLIEKEIKLKKEREEEKRRVFNVDKNLFNRLIKEINDQTRDINDIPILFKNKFIIFQKLIAEYSKEKLNESEEYEKYNEIEKNLNLKNIELNTTYNNIFGNNSVYSKIYNNLKHINNSDSEDDDGEDDDEDDDDDGEDDDGEDDDDDDDDEEEDDDDDEEDDDEEEDDKIDDDKKDNNNDKKDNNNDKKDNDNNKK